MFDQRDAGFSQDARAYDSLSGSLESTDHRALGWRIFRELAENFAELVSVLDAFAEQSGLYGARSPDRFVLAWKKLRGRRGSEEWRNQNGGNIAWH